MIAIRGLLGNKSYHELTCDEISVIASAYRTTRIWSVNIVEDLQRLSNSKSYEEYKFDKDGFSSLLDIASYLAVKKLF